MEPSLVRDLTKRSAARGLAGVLACAVVLFTSVAGAAPNTAARTAPPPAAYEPADSLEGNYLAAYIAGVARDTVAAASYYREALKGTRATPNSWSAPLWRSWPTARCRKRSARPSGSSPATPRTVSLI
jgi:hypothetical protein